MATGGAGVQGRNRFFASRCSASCGALGGASPLAGGYAPLCSPVRHLHCAPLCAVGLLQRAIRADRLRPAHFLAFRLPTCPRFLASFGSSPPSRNRPCLSSWPFFPTTPAVLSPWTSAVSRSVRVPVPSPVFVWSFLLNLMCGPRSTEHVTKGVLCKTLKKGAGSKGYRSGAAIMSDSPGSSDRACLIDGRPELPIQHGQLNHPAPRVVKVPCKIMLDLMLEELALPKARYDNHTDERGRVSAVVTFYMSAGVPGNLLRPVKMGGAEAADSETAEDSAAKEAIRILETWENMEVEDLHYSELKYVKEAKEDLYKKLEAAQGDMKKLHSVHVKHYIRLLAKAGKVARKVVYICKEAVLQQALKSLSLEIHESRTCYVGNNQMVGSIRIAAPTHGPYSMLHNKTIYGDYKTTEEDALESARIAALLYLQKIGVIFVDDINQTELTNCQAKLADCQQKLFTASNWADIFQGQAESLKAKLAIAYEENEKLMKQAKAYNIKKEVLQTQATDVKKEIPTLPLFNVGKDSSTPLPFNNTANARSLQSEMERIIPNIGVKKALFKTEPLDDCKTQEPPHVFTCLPTPSKLVEAPTGKKRKLILHTDRSSSTDNTDVLFAKDIAVDSGSALRPLLPLNNKMSGKQAIKATSNAADSNYNP